MGTNMIMAALRSIRQPTINKEELTIKRKTQGLEACAFGNCATRLGTCWVVSSQDTALDVAMSMKTTDVLTAERTKAGGMSRHLSLLGNQEAHHHRIRHRDGCCLGGGEDAPRIPPKIITGMSSAGNTVHIAGKELSPRPSCGPEPDTRDVSR